MRLGWLAMAMLGCSEQGPSILGSPDDVSLVPGARDGFTIEECREGLWRVETEGEAVDVHTLNEALGPVWVVDSIVAVGGLGLSQCAQGVEEVSAVWLHDWRDLDEVVPLVGNTLVDAGIGATVEVQIQAPIVALRGAAD